MKKILYIFLAIVVVAIVIILVARPKKVVNSTPQAQPVPTTETAASNPCPDVFAENADWKLTVNGCTPETDGLGQALTGTYIASSLTIASADGAVNQTFSGMNLEFTTPDSGLPSSTPRFFVNADKSYFFLDQGTSNVRTLTVLSLTGAPRMIALTYTGNLVLTKNGYLAYSALSTDFPNARPQIEVSAALDALALKLSDFSVHTIEKGTATVDYAVALPANATVTPADFIAESDAATLALEKITWADPATSAKTTTTTVSVPVGDLGK